MSGVAQTCGPSRRIQPRAAAGHGPTALHAPRGIGDEHLRHEARVQASGETGKRQPGLEALPFKGRVWVGMVSAPQPSRRLRPTPAAGRGADATL